MSHIHFIGGEKGGVGKSLVSRLIAQYLIDHERPFKGFDTDRSHGALLRFYTNYSSAVLMDQYESLDAIVEAATSDSGQRVVVDMAAQSQEALTRWMEDSGLLELSSELGLMITYWHVMDSGRDSVDLLKKLLDRFGSRLNYILVKNQVRGENFDALDASGEMQRALELHARVIDIKRLHEAAMRKIDTHSSSFWSAIHNTDAQPLGLLERQRVKLWLKSAYAQLDSLHL